MLLSIVAGLPDRVFVLGDPLKELEMEHKNDRLGMISNVASHKNQMLFVSENRLTLWTADFTSDTLLSFSGSGDGPGEREAIRETWRINHKGTSPAYLYFPLKMDQWLIYQDKLYWMSIKEGVATLPNK